MSDLCPLCRRPSVSDAAYWNRSEPIPPGSCLRQGGSSCDAARDERERKMERTCEVARCFINEADTAIRHATTKGGQQVPYTGDFAGVLHLSSGLSILRRWRDLFARALDGEGA